MVQPSSRRRVTKAAVHELQTVASAPSIPIRRSSPPCCARAAMGHVPARPQTILMNSRRSMASLRPKGHTGAPERYQIIDGELLPASHLKGEFPMSALGQKQTSEPVRSMSALPPKADIDRGAIHSCNEQWLSSACGRLVACRALRLSNPQFGQSTVLIRLNLASVGRRLQVAHMKR